MDSNRIFVDTNVIIGAWTGRNHDQNCLQYLFSLRGKRLYLSTLSIAQFVSIFQHKKSDSEIRKQVKYLLSKFSLVSFTEKDVEKSLDEPSHDMEDNIQFVLCSKMNCQHFVTNNIKDYSNYFLLDVLKPKECRKINQ